MKYEWRKQEKNLYLPKQKPELITIPVQKFFMIKGKGNPNSEEFVRKNRCAIFIGLCDSNDAEARVNNSYSFN